MIVIVIVIVAGFFVYFDTMSLAEEQEGDCEDDYVQFGRDILFITSHRSNKFCGQIEGSLIVPHPGSLPSNSTENTSTNATPLGFIAVMLYYLNYPIRDLD